MALVNAMEEIVKAKIDKLIADTDDCCTCDKCREDMACLALNALPAKYVSTNKGALFSKLSAMVKQNTADIDVACINAINSVKDNPKHDDEE
ncbi:MAG: late competence development ComFB family protein [Clostridium sp.]|nr:late competence development ComFB family protein [Clostridium sp.]MCM1547623.1 late competence development ComFB family protein [Ruminococcus sp.]